MRTRILCTTTFVSVVSVAGACTPARIAVPADLAKEAEEIQVTDRSRMTGAFANESFKMGPFQITDVDRKWNSSSGFSIGSFSSEGKKTGYSFTFKGPAGEAKAKCASEQTSKGAKLFGGTISSTAATIGCQCEGPGAQSQLVLSTNQSSTYGGQAQTRVGAFSVTAIDKCETGSCGVSTAGYDIRAQSAAGAFEIFHPGRLWLARSLAGDARADLACLAAGILLYQPPSEN